MSELRLTRRIFLAGLGLTYAVAFTSLGVQIAGLVGPDGILPAGEHLAAAREYFGGPSPGRFPTIFWWIEPSSRQLEIVAFGGALLATLAGVGVAPGPLFLLSWLGYLSLVTVGQDFLSFQWDVLLLETGFLAIFLAPWRRAVVPREVPVPRGPLWLVRVLLFKLMLMSGLVKLSSGDPTWRDLTALTYHYWTTCLPTWIGWYAHQLPEWLHRASAAAMFGIEIGVPFAIFGPRRFRLLAAAILAALQVGIALTGNYGFFNLLSLVLCVTLLDDEAIRRLLRRPSPEVVPDPPDDVPVGLRSRVGRSAARATLPLVLISLSLMHFQMRFFGFDSLPTPARAMVRVAAPWHVASGYGLFASMTTTRREIVLEGSNDGESWQAYEFRHKPGDPSRRPGIVQPHMPRLDWQMWFAALGPYQRSPWFPRLMERVGEGSPEVLALLATNPFAGAPPRYVRAVVWDYAFTDAVGRSEGRWWDREFLGLYAPVWSAPDGGP